jgi:flagellar basal body-associated protein FliL
MVKKRKVRRRKKRKLRRNIIILSFVILMAVMVIISLYQSKQSQKEPADEYFSFSEAYALATPMDDTNRTIKISLVGFNITAVGGSATSVSIRALEGMASLENSEYFEEIAQAESVPVEITYDRYPAVSTKTPEGYPVSFHISCSEAKGKVTIYIVEFFYLPSS